MTFETKARAYVRTIRNANKRQYAERYLAYLLNLTTQEPERGELGGMAAQVVRLNLYNMLGNRA